MSPPLPSTAPLERQFGQLPVFEPDEPRLALEAVRSSSCSFSLDLNIDVAEQEVQAAINSAQTYLPTGLPSPADLQQNPIQPMRRSSRWG